MDEEVRQDGCPGLGDPEDRSEVQVEGSNQEVGRHSQPDGTPEAFDEVPLGGGDPTTSTNPRDAHPTSGSPLVGGRLLLFAETWEQLNPGPWVLETIQSGYKIEFSSRPPQDQLMKVTRVPTDLDQRKALTKELAELLRKRAIQIVPEGSPEKLYRSSFFLTRKAENLWRPILNLKPQTCLGGTANLPGRLLDRAGPPLL